ncbi:hypothetical protein [Corynebacterium uterequi]|uniref:Integral membrane protein n=1 Tax=Corynebacterium uterequi TaxID=1072256 RepID=A0A0G3HEX8_9CORY|nr:hypothetical protein [Corynebacterium uterequi]AKK11280.1 hypothetical protein CUTER_06455 [Corynebacterium uterequi]
MNTPLDGAVAAELESGSPRIVGAGTVHPLQALSWGMTAAFANWQLWILLPASIVAAYLLSEGVLASSSLLAHGELASLTPVITVASSFLPLLVGPFVTNAVIRQLDRSKVGWADLVREVNFWPLLGITLLIAAMNTVIFGIFETPLFSSFFALTPDTLADAAAFRTFLLGLGLYFLVSTLVFPLFLFAPYYVADRQAGVGEALTKGLRDSLRNYLRLVLFFLLMLLVTVVVSFMTLGVGFVFVVAGFLLAAAYMYREAAGLPVGVAVKY